MSQSRSKVRIMVECALMIALATLLSYIPIFEMPQGGSITLCSMLPIMMASWRHGLKWGLFTGFVHGVLQMMMGIENVMYCTTILTMAGCIALDYILAYTALGSADLFKRMFKNQNVGIAVSCVVVGLMRLVCSFLSGMLIWGAYAPSEMPVWLYSLTYNSSYMIPEIILTTVAAVVVARLVLPRLSAAEQAA